MRGVWVLTDSGPDPWCFCEGHRNFELTSKGKKRGKRSLLFVHNHYKWGKKNKYDRPITYLWGRGGAYASSPPPPPPQSTKCDFNKEKLLHNGRHMWLTSCFSCAADWRKQFWNHAESWNTHGFEKSYNITHKATAGFSITWLKIVGSAFHFQQENFKAIPKINAST